MRVIVTCRTAGAPFMVYVRTVTVLPTATSWGSWESCVIVYFTTRWLGPVIVMNWPGS